MCPRAEQRKSIPWWPYDSTSVPSRNKGHEWSDVAGLCDSGIDASALAVLSILSPPVLHHRTEDIEPNLDFELDGFAEKAGRRVTFSNEARERFLSFALSPGPCGRAISAT
jgi:hypothetical protein